MDINMFMSGLALLAATVCLILVFLEKKRNKKRNAAMLNYISTECGSAVKSAAEYTNSKIPDVNAVNGQIAEVRKMVEDIGENVMNASNAFQDQLGQTLSNIMNFDPMEAQRKARRRAMGVGEDE